MIKYTLSKIFLLAVITATPCLTTFGMEQQEKIPTSYNSYNGIIIGPDTIAQLAQKYGLPEKKATVVREWRNNNKELIKRMTEFNFPNSQWLSHVRETKALLAEQGIDYVGKGDASQDWKSYMFPVPGAEEFILYVATPYYRLENLKRYHGHDWDFARDRANGNKPIPEKLDTLKQESTFQTVSEYTNGLLFEQASREHNFNNFRALRTYLEPVDENQSTDNDNDNGFFALQERLETPVVQLFDTKNPQRVREILDKNPQAFYELMVATNAIGLWDQSKVLVDEHNQLHIYSLRQPDNSNPKYFTGGNLKSGSYSSYSSLTKTGFSSIYDFCKENNIREGQIKVQEFVRSNVDLPSKDQQQELEKHLELNQ